MKLKHTTKPRAPQKYYATTYLGRLVTGVSIYKEVSLDEEGETIEIIRVRIHGEVDGISEVLNVFNPSYEIDLWSGADYLLCAIQDEEGLELSKY